MRKQLKEMEGYFVVTKDSDDEQSTQVKALLKQSKLVDLKCTRTFNRVTKGEYGDSVSSARSKIRNARDEQRQKRKEYHEREDVKKRTKEYNRLPEVKERKRLERIRKKKILSMVPREIIEKVYKEESAENKS